MALGVVLLATIGAVAATWKVASARRHKEIETANWWLLTTVILLLQILLLFGPLG